MVSSRGLIMRFLRSETADWITMIVIVLYCLKGF